MRKIVAAILLLAGTISPGGAADNSCPQELLDSYESYVRDGLIVKGVLSRDWLRVTVNEGKWKGLGATDRDPILEAAACRFGSATTPIDTVIILSGSGATLDARAVSVLRPQEAIAAPRIPTKSSDQLGRSGQVASPTTSPDAGELAPSSQVPLLQSRFITAVENARAAYRSGANEMAKGATRPSRARAICAVLPSPQVSGWIGTIKNLSTNNDGRGIVEVLIGDEIVIKTWNNAVSDIGDKTLIDPISALYHKVLTFQQKQRVRVSGTFIRSPADCVSEASVTMDGSMTEPDFIFRFFAIEPVP